MPVPTRRHDREFLDLPDLHRSDLRDNLRDIRRLNAWFGGRRLAVDALGQALEGRRRARVLDVATGSGDVPLALFKWGVSHNVDLRIVVSDISPLIVAEARQHLVGSNVQLARADVRTLPWSDGAFDVVSCCLALHHFTSVDAVRALREMWRVASSAIVVTDLTRSYAAYIGTWLATRTVASNVLTKHDGPLSVLRAYSPQEMGELAAAAGISPVTVQAYPLFRQVLIGWKDGRPSHD